MINRCDVCGEICPDFSKKCDTCAYIDEEEDNDKKQRLLVEGSE